MNTLEALKSREKLGNVDWTVRSPYNSFTVRTASTCLSDSSVEPCVRVNEISVIEGVKKRIECRVGISHEQCDVVDLQGNLTVTFEANIRYYTKDAVRDPADEKDAHN